MGFRLSHLFFTIKYFVRILLLSTFDHNESSSLSAEDHCQLEKVNWQQNSLRILLGKSWWYWQLNKTAIFKRFEYFQVGRFSTKYPENITIWTRIPRSSEKWTSNHYNGRNAKLSNHHWTHGYWRPWTPWEGNVPTKWHLHLGKISSKLSLFYHTSPCKFIRSIRIHQTFEWTDLPCQ